MKINFFEKNRGSFLLIGVLLMFFLLGSSVSAESYDIYVEADYDGSEEGSEKKPFKTIAKAIEQAEEGDKIYLEEGEYEENFTVNKKLSFFGESQEEVKIEGEIKVTKDFEAQDFTLEGNIVAENGADIELNNLVIEEADKIGVEALGDSGEVIIKNSVVKKSGTKGIYVQAGREVVISGCSIYGNQEDGIDLRENVDGVISGNNIYENGKNGIRFVVANSKLEIKNNSIKNNGDGGIVAKSIASSSASGSIVVNSNTSITNDYGFDCDFSQNKVETSYWKNSIKIDKNNFKTNKEDEINKECGLVQPTQVALEKKQEEARKKEVEENQEKKEEQLEMMEQNKERTIEENKNQLNQLVEAKSQLQSEVEEQRKKIEKRGWLISFLIGPNYGAINKIKEVAPGFGENLSQFDDLDRKLIDSENQKIAQQEMENIVNYVEEVNALIVKRDSRFSLFGWLFGLFG